MAGLFKTENCLNCGAEMKGREISPLKVEGGLHLCKECYNKLFDNIQHPKELHKINAEQLREKLHKIAMDEEECAAFQATKKVMDFFYLDESQNKFAIPTRSAFGKVKGMKVYKCQDILDFELLEDGNSVIKGGLGRAVVGGALFGGVGAIVGGTTGGRKQKKTSAP